MKKKLIFLVFAAVSVPLFSLDIDTGFGVNFGYNYSSLKTMKDSANYDQAYGSGGIGQYLFVDAKYIEGSINFFFTNTSLKHNEGLASYDGFSGDYNLNGISIGFGLLAKYPFYLNRFIFYPLAGFEANVCVSQSFSKDYADWDNAKKGYTYGAPNTWNAFYIRAGMGGDYLFSDGLFFRGELILDIKLPNGLDKAYIANPKFKDAGFETPQFFGIGVSFRLALGFKISNILGFTSPPRSAPLPPPSKEGVVEKKKPPTKTPPKKRRDPNVYVPQD